MPVELGRAGDGTHPEQLLSGGWSACFDDESDAAAAQRQFRLGDVDVTASIALLAENHAYWLSAVLEAGASAVDQTTLASALADAHQLCSYFKATRGNIQVELVAKAA